MIKRLAKRIAKYAVVFYAAQALVGIGVGVYFAVTLDPAEIERMVSYVAY